MVHGANGSGKSTLLRTIYGDHAVAAGGSIVREGIVPGVPLEKFKLRTAYVAPHLQTWHAPKMPVMEVVASGRYASIGLNDAITASDRRHAERALRRFGMLALRDRTLAEMSYGQARRVLFARAWAREPRWRCSTSRSRVSIARRARISRGGSTSGWPMAAAA